ncbi:MAG: tetratricopeptide repeat protein, partial [Fidelibacterota bacterium]
PDDSIVNPARLSPDLKMDVCRQCHLQGEVSVFRAGKTSLSFRPGMRLSDVKTIFIREGLPSGDFRIASHGARLSLSACFSQSRGQLVCTTCHDPHVPVKKVPRSAFNGTCTGCHDTGTLASVMDPGAHMAGGDCVQCHMRQGATSDILHVNFTDHWIRKDIQVLSKNETDSMMTLRPSVPVRLRDFFEQSDPEAGLRLGIAYVRFYEGRHGHPEYLRRAVTLLEEALRAGHTGPESKDAHYYLGIAFARQGKLELARREFQQGVELDPDNVFAQFQLGTVLYQLGRLEGAEGAFREALTVSPETPKAWKKMGDVYVNQGRFDEGLDAYENAARIRPGFAAARNALGGLWAYHFRDLEKARTELEIAVTLEPNFTLALHNLGNVHVLLGDDSGALDFFQRAVTVDPRFAAAHGSLATIYEKRGEREKAIFYLNRLLTLEPGNEDALTLLGRLNE